MPSIIAKNKTKKSGRGRVNLIPVKSLWQFLPLGVRSRELLANLLLTLGSGKAGAALSPAQSLLFSFHEFIDPFI